MKKLGILLTLAVAGCRFLGNEGVTAVGPAPIGSVHAWTYFPEEQRLNLEVFPNDTWIRERFGYNTIRSITYAKSGSEIALKLTVTKTSAAIAIGVGASVDVEDIASGSYTVSDGFDGRQLAVIDTSKLRGEFPNQ
jgi:hypothetical protein